MKLTHKFLLVGSLVTLSLASASWGRHKAEAAEPCPAGEENCIHPDDHVVVDEGEVTDGGEIVDGGEGVDGGGAVDGSGNQGEEPVVEITLAFENGEAVEKGEGTKGEPSELVDPNVVDIGGSEVQRGEDKSLDPNVIFQTTALDGGGPVAPAGKMEAGFGSDERAADIESKGPGRVSVKSEKKGPVALVKKGRVFLR